MMAEEHEKPGQTEAALEKLKAWLETYPNWDETIQVNFSGDSPYGTGLLPKAVEEISRWEDVLGNSQVECRYTFTLFWQMMGQGDDAVNAARLLDFQHWVREQNALGLAPQFGDAPAWERIRAENGGFTAGAQTVIYTVTLIADFKKVYEGNE